MFVASYSRRKNEIISRLADFAAIPRTPETLFPELAFCLLTPQSKAVNCDSSLKEMMRQSVLFDGTEDAVKACVRGVRFHNQKSRNIVEARKHMQVLPRVVAMPPTEGREWLVTNIRGIGYKEASHFLRNVGNGKNIAILDRHILKNLLKHGAINEIPKTMTKKRYMEIEEKMREFSRKVKMPMEHMDLLFWAEEAGMVFK
ncbi:MAG: N-glycosylase/DNA lyase [Candidatus Aenigmarchaeota archaeon]|nr:N-glycosylase/DNA lyase [Candidatus Aenigmarchaeota archaeon]